MINTIYSINAKPFLGEENRYHYLYMITNKVNGKIYIGIHSTMNLDDGYSGSGLLLKRTFKKYGINNFQKEILEFYNTRKELAEKEHELVNEAFAESDNTYNLVVGGNPKETWDYRTQIDRMSASASERAKRMWAQPGFREKMLQKLHSEEHRKKRSEITKAIWNREGYREKHNAIVNSKEYREATSKRVKELWNDPEYRKKVSESNKRHGQIPKSANRCVKYILENMYQKKRERKLVNQVKEEDTVLKQRKE